MISCFLDPYPEELFYSVCARYKASRRYANYQTVSRVLFGGGYNAVIEFPCRLGYLANHLPPGNQYTTDLLINKYTLFPYYQPFLPMERVQQILQHMVVGPGPGKNFQLLIGIKSSVVTPLAFLRYCPACVAAERATLGECYWHRLHQAPGVVVCPHHEVFLEDSQIPTTTALRANTFFAAEESISDTMPHSAKDSPFFQRYKRLALSIAELLEGSFPPSEPGFWREQYPALMAQHEYLTPRELFRCEEFLQAFSQFCPLEFQRQLGCQINLEPSHWRSWWAAMRGSGRTIAPLVHLLILQMLDVGVASFFRQRFSPPKKFGAGPWPCLNPVCGHYKQSVIMSFEFRKNNSQAQVAGLFACTCGFTYTRLGPESHPEDRFKYSTVLVYGRVWDDHLRQWWADPALNQREIGRRLGVTSATVRKQAIRLGLPIPRPSNRNPFRSGSPKSQEGKDVAWYRKQWLALLKAHPDATRTELYRLLHGVHSWLWLHDRLWLNQHLPPARPRHRPKRRLLSNEANQVPVVLNLQNLDDAELAATVRRVTLLFYDSPERPERISERMLRRAVPSLVVLRSAPDRFPLTAQAVKESVETRECWGLRRVNWALQRYLEERICPTRPGFIRRANIFAIREVSSIQQAIDEAMLALEPLKGQGALLSVV